MTWVTEQMLASFLEIVTIGEGTGIQEDEFTFMHLKSEVPGNHPQCLVSNYG